MPSSNALWAIMSIPLALPTWGRHSTLTPSWTSTAACTVSPVSELLIDYAHDPARQHSPDLRHDRRTRGGMDAVRDRLISARSEPFRTWL
jgi:hypothetical protein